jgi:cytochrome P450
MSRRDPATPFDPYAPSSADRYAAMARIREQGGGVDTAVGTYIASAAGVLGGLQDVDKFVGSFVDTSALPPDEVMISAIPEPRHGRIRRVINSVLAPRMGDIMAFAGGLAEALVEGAVATARTEGSVDLVSAMIDPYPSAVIARVLGVPVEDHPQFRRWSDELLERQQGGDGSFSNAHPEFAAYIDAAIAARRASSDPPDDVITRFVKTEIDGEHLSDVAVRTQTMFLIVAGNETTRNLLSNLFYRLATDSALYRVLQADAELVSVAIEESLRVDSPVQVLARSVLDEAEIAGCPLSRGDRVVFGIASANRDESLYSDPEAFRLDRPRPRNHLAFGAGRHICPGATLARGETVLMVETFLRAVERFELVPDGELTSNPVFWALGQRSLPVQLHD